MHYYFKKELVLRGPLRLAKLEGDQQGNLLSWFLTKDRLESWYDDDKDFDLGQTRIVFNGLNRVSATNDDIEFVNFVKLQGRYYYFKQLLRNSGQNLKGSEVTLPAPFGLYRTLDVENVLDCIYTIMQIMQKDPEGVLHF